MFCQGAATFGAHRLMHQGVSGFVEAGVGDWEVGSWPALLDTDCS